MSRMDVLRNEPTALHVLSTGRYGVLPIIGSFTVGGNVSTISWPAANRAIYAPIQLPAATLIARFMWGNGGDTTGNADAGIYDASGNLIISTGSTARSGTSTMQYANVTDTVIGPGHYYLALASASTGSFFRSLTLTAEQLRTVGWLQQASAFPLPSSMTGATIASSSPAVFGFTQDGSL